MNPNLLKNLLIAAVVVWGLLWKFYSVWTAIKHNKKRWFVALMLLNTFGILDIIYIFYIEKKTWPEVKGTFLRVMKSGI